ncbi:MAG: hypothetical protein M3174_00730 [Actinomycetota bacterium]|nr:hypothetical protein [Actinomycetota bacterium]
MHYQTLSSGRQSGRGRAKWAISFLTCALLGSLLGAVPARADMSARSLLPRPDVAPANGALFGSYIKPFTDSWKMSDWEAALDKRERDMGRALDINHHYSGWTKPFPNWMLDWDASEGRLSMVSLDGPASMSEITNGSQDEIIRGHADAVRTFGKPVFLRWLWEMDARTWQVESPEAFVAAWRRMHDIFDARGATNALWTWCPTAWNFTTGSAQRYYPGDAYVDWICSDGYNWAPGRPDAEWRSFKDIFADFYAWGAARNKPLMVGETGTEERYANEKANWYSNVVPAMKSYPKMKALVYFDTATSDFGGGWYNWRPDTSTSAYNAYIGMARDPYLNQSVEVPPDPPVDRTVSVSIDGPGSVTAPAAGLSCPPTCSTVVADGTSVTLTATPDVAGGFQGWGGACSGAGTTCTIDVTSDRSVTAKFVSKTLPKPRLTKPDKRHQSSSSITVSWTADELVPAESYQLRTRSASNRRLIAEATPLVQGVAGTSTITMDGDAGKTYCYEVRSLASDAASEWSDEKCTSVPLDDTAFRREGKWDRKSADASYGGSYSKSNNRGARLVRRGVKAKHLALLARGCRRCGKVKVLWNRRSLGRYDLGRKRGPRKIDLASFSSVRTGKVKIVVISKRGGVKIDGLGISQR